MSIINDALKKAQRQKEYNIAGYHGAYAAGGNGGGMPIRKIILFLALLLSIAALTIPALQFMSSRSRQREVNESVSVESPKLASRIDENAISIYEKARACHLNGNFEEAKKLYLKSLDLDPGLFDAINNLGVLFIREGDFEKGIDFLEKAIRLRPGQVDPYYNLACLLAIRGDVEKSLIYLGKAMALDGSVKDWARKDKDLDNLRGIKEFELMISNNNKI